MILTFDVETFGLYGEAFAVGYVINFEDGDTLLEGLHSCPVEEATAGRLLNTDIEGTHRWLGENVLPHLPPPDCFTTRAVRDKFMAVVRSARSFADKHSLSFYLMADVAWPCEAQFLLDCLRDDVRANSSLMPYPLLDLSSILLAKGYKPTDTFPRKEGENPAHNPLNDARQSARIYRALLKGEHPNG